MAFAPESMRKCPTLPSRTTNIDRISKLSNSLLSHILSFLPTKQAVATSILSTRWRQLWTSVSNLDFDDELFSGPRIPQRDEGEKMNFSQFVSRVLMLCNSQTIKKFSLKCGYMNCNSFDVNTWVSATIARKVEQLELNLSPYHAKQIVLSHLFFTCKTFVILKLRGDMVINIHSPFQFPSLKILHLQGVIFANGDSFRMFFGGCQLLEDLIVERININQETYLDFAISLPRLVKSGIDFSRSSFLTLDIVKATRNVSNLMLSASTTEKLDVFYVDNFPTFYNLVRLKLQFNCYGWAVLANFLQKSHNLQVLYIEKVDSNSNYQSTVWECPQIIPECLSSNLTAVIFRGFEGTLQEFEFVKYILRSARALKIMKIETSFKVENQGILRKLSILTRRSDKCHLLFQ